MDVPIDATEKQDGFSGLVPYVVWIVALIATGGSLFFSEVMELPPCVLCWYQRIAMYPLVVIGAVGIVCSDRRWKWYALPLAVIGFVISVYHNLLYYGLIPESITPCTEGISCTSRQIEWLGFITIPLMALVSFSLVLILLFIYNHGLISRDGLERTKTNKTKEYF